MQIVTVIAIVILSIAVILLGVAVVCNNREIEKLHKDLDSEVQDLRKRILRIKLNQHGNYITKKRELKGEKDHA